MHRQTIPLRMAAWVFFLAAALAIAPGGVRGDDTGLAQVRDGQSSTSKSIAKPAPSMRLVRPIFRRYMRIKRIEIDGQGQRLYGTLQSAPRVFVICELDAEAHFFHLRTGDLFECDGDTRGTFGPDGTMLLFIRQWLAI